MICTMTSKTQVKLRKDDILEAVTQFLNYGQYSNQEVEVTDIIFHDSDSVYVVTAEVIRKGSTFTED